MNLADLRALAVEVSLTEDGDLRLRAAPGLLTPQLKQATAEAKPRLLEELRGLRREPVNLVNMVNFDSQCLCVGSAPSTASGKVHRASAPETPPILKQTGAFLVGGLSSEAEDAVLAWRDRSGESDAATIGGVIAACRRDPEARAYFRERAAEAVRRQCANCRHSRRPGGVVLHCSAGRPDLPLPDGEGHPLRRLPDDQGCRCPTFRGLAEEAAGADH